MEVVTIVRKSTCTIVAVIERPCGMTKEAVARAWSKSQGYESLPSDCRIAGSTTVESFASILFNLIPVDESSRIRGGSI